MLDALEALLAANPIMPRPRAAPLARRGREVPSQEAEEEV
jgi:hypothetical protein